MALCVSKEFLRVDVFDASLVHNPRGDVAGGDQVAQPGRGVGVDLVVEGGHATPFQVRRLTTSATEVRGNPNCSATAVML